MSDVYLGNRYPNIYLKLSGGEMSGPISTYGIKISSAVDYGTTLPETGTEGQLFFQLSDPYYEIPAGGTTGQVLSKKSNTDRDIQWSNLPSLSNFVLKTGDTMTGNLTMSGSSINFNWQNATRTANTIYTLGNLSFKNVNGDKVYSAPWLRFMGTDGTDGYNTCVMYGSANGTTWVTAGESGATLPVALSAYNNEDLYLSADGAVKIYSGCANDSSSYTLALECRANGYTYANKLYGAVWNDYAEYRKDNTEEKDTQEPGRCVKENGDGILSLTTKRLERGCEIISDTFGFAIGQDEENGYNTPIASNGRVLAYPYEPIEEFSSHVGWPVCSGPNGTVSIMTEEEEEKYPSRIIGTISEIPTYETWGTGNVKVNGRIWIRIR